MARLQIGVGLISHGEWPPRANGTTHSDPFNKKCDIKTLIAYPKYVTKNPLFLSISNREDVGKWDVVSWQECWQVDSVNVTKATMKSALILVIFPFLLATSEPIATCSSRNGKCMTARVVVGCISADLQT
jgi:hypothetical protein